MTQLFQRAAYDWLSLRHDADRRARESAAPLLSLLNGHLPTMSEVEVLDLGAGSGANIAWLAQRLPMPQRWTLIDRDAHLLHAARTVQTPRQVLSVCTQQRSIDDLTVREVRAAGLVTASAVLDILSFTQLERLARLLDEAGVPALFSLNVTGVVRLSPALSLDEEITAAFNQHQLRAGLAGPHAADHLSRRLQQAGVRVLTAPTPWVLGTPADPELHDHALVERYLTERAAAAVEQHPHLTALARSWLTARRAQLEKHSLTVRVEHVDVLALPAP